MADPSLTARVAAVRGFNRFYTNVIGVLQEGLLRSSYSLTEARVIFELAQQETTEVADLRSSLRLDAGYLSRILARFAADGLIEQQRSTTDGRRHVIRLTNPGRAAFELLDSRSSAEIGGLLSRLPESEQGRLVSAMGTIRALLEDAPSQGDLVLRPPEPGDYGWVVQRHGVVYAREYGWDETFEALVAGIVSAYVKHRDPRRERAWIAEANGRRAGCIFCVRQDEYSAKLRLLLVEPDARGRGVGARLVDECVRFAGQAGYKRVTLWTNEVLSAARRLYERAGFRLVEEERHHSFGHDLVGQNWVRPL